MKTTDTKKVGDYTYFFSTDKDLINMKIDKVYKKNAPKRVQWYRYKTIEDMDFAKERFIEEKQSTLKQKAEYATKRKLERKTKATELRNSYKIGDLFSYSWGYDQTNIEYFQITEKKGAKVYIKRIGGETTSIDSWASQHSKPKKDSFLTGWQAESNGWKIIGEWGIKMDFGHLNPTTEKDEHFSSSRA